MILIFMEMNILIHCVIILNFKSEKMKIEELKKRLNFGQTIELVKFKNLKQVIESENKKYLQKNQKSMINNENISQLDLNNHLIHYKNFVLRDNHINHFYIDILFYYDWYPHILKIFFIDPDVDFCKVMYFLLNEFQKNNIQEWNIFEDNQKIEMTFNEFLLYLISNNKNFQRYFISKKQYQYFGCFNCNQKIIKISNEYYLCHKYNKKSTCPYSICPAPKKIRLIKKRN
jgi:predicted nucleotidyltransferase